MTTSSQILPGCNTVGPRADVAERLARARARWQGLTAELVERGGPALLAVRECLFDAFAASVQQRACVSCERSCERTEGGIEPVAAADLVRSLRLLAADALATRAPELLGTALAQVGRCRQSLVGTSLSAVAVGDPKPAELAAAAPASRLVGSSAQLERVRRQIAVAARGHGSVFVAGESGTGKELAVRAFHDALLASSPDRPLVVVNCATLPSELMESELFGYRKGAYTGAQRSYDGLVRAADGGTLFLDEITEMKPEGQAKLLRVLEESAVRPIGTCSEVRVAVRFVASTNRDPIEAVRSGVLRADVYHRLNVHRIEMPPLRDHRDDIPELVSHFVAGLVERTGAVRREFSDAALAVMRAFDWPGNVRGLRNAVTFALSAARGAQVEPPDLPAHVRAERGAGAPPRGECVLEQTARIPTFVEAERELIVRALAATDGNKRRAAQLLGISRHRLYDKIRKYHVAT